MNPNETFALAWRHHQEGDLSQAEQLYRQVVGADPAHSDAWCFLGAACQARGDLAQAESNFRRAIQLLPHHASALNCLGVLLAGQGKLSEAAACFQQAASFDPLDADAQNNLGLVHAGERRFAEAVRCYEKALAIRADFAAARGNLEAARHALRKVGPPAIQNVVPSSQNVGQAVYEANLRGVELAQEGNYDEAWKMFESALRFDADDADGHNNLGNLLSRKKRYEEAIGHYQYVLRRQPNHVTSTYNLGVVYGHQGRDDEAIAQYELTLRLKPDHVDAHYNMGILLAKHGKVEEAIAKYDRVLQLQPNYSQAHWNRAMLWLSNGDFERGWPAYEWRWVQPGVVRHTFPQPLWDGSPLNGRTILLHAEQGLGDTLQFIRYAPLVKQRGGKVVLECQPPLARLLAHAEGVDCLIPKGKPLPECDVQAPLLSLPGIFKSSLKDIPATTPYLKADAELVEHWRRELKPIKGLKVGIAWQGSPTFREDHLRSIPLTNFAQLAEIKGVQIISLQKGPGTEQLIALSRSDRILDLSSRLDEANGPFMDTAAVMMNLDLVISSDTAVPHLAGALGVPVWVALHLVPDWRWLLHREDSPWYSRMRLYRQTKSGRWDDVFERLFADLKVKAEMV